MNVMDSSKFIGLDIGASNCKAIMIDNQGQVCRISRKNMPGIITMKPGYFEISPAEVKKIVLGVLKELIREDGGNIKAVGVTGQMHGMMFIDEGLNPLGNFISWQDQRTTHNSEESRISIMDRMIESFPDMHRKTGSFLRSGMMGPLFNWFGSLSRIPSTAQTITFLPEYICSILTDRPPISNDTQAAATGVYDVKQRRWDRKYIEYARIPETLLPRVLSVGTSCGRVSMKVSQQTGLSPGARVFSAVGDFQAALFGAGLSAGDVSINIGTGAQVSLCTKGFRVYDGIETRPFFDNCFLLCIPGLSAGRALAVYRRFVEGALRLCTGRDHEGDVLRQIDERALDLNTDQFPDCHSNFFDAAEGVFCSLNHENFSVAHLYGALIEDLARQYYEAYQKIAVNSRLNAERVILSGGVARRSRLLRRLIAEKFDGLEILLTAEEEEAATGIGRLALKWDQNNSYRQ